MNKDQGNASASGARGERGSGVDCSHVNRRLGCPGKWLGGASAVHANDIR